MENNSTESTPQNNPASQAAGANKQKIYPFVYLLAGLCILCTLGLWVEESMATDSLWGYYSSVAIWDGAYWAYLTSCFVHGDILHLYFNLYWLFILGRPFEREYGFVKSCVFFVCMAVITSGLEFRISEDTGIGLSGVIYGMFAFMWATKSQYQSFEKLITPRLVNLFITWLLACFVLTLLRVWQVGNVAHLTGLIFGWLAGRALVLKKQAGLSVVVLVCSIAIAIAPMFWMPGSIDWVNLKAYQAGMDENNESALKWYSRSIQMDPNDAWAYYGRALAYRNTGRYEESQKDIDKVLQIDPDYLKEMVSDPNEK